MLSRGKNVTVHLIRDLTALPSGRKKPLCHSSSCSNFYAVCIQRDSHDIFSLPPMTPAGRVVAATGRDRLISRTRALFESFWLRFFLKNGCFPEVLNLRSTIQPSCRSRAHACFLMWLLDCYRQDDGSLYSLHRMPIRHNMTVKIPLLHSR